MATPNKRPKAVLAVTNPQKTGNFIVGARTVVLDIGNNTTLFATPTPTLASVTTAITNLETAEALAHTRVAGSVAARDLKYDVLLKAMHGLLNYVQNLADNAADIPTAISIINASGFGLRNAPVRTKAPLAAKKGAVSGTVNLVAMSAGPRASYNWRKSNDTITWMDLPPTLQAKTTVAGLTVASTVYFQYRAITKTGAGDWSQSVSILVQ
jgi:hypothetical protein